MKAFAFCLGVIGFTRLVVHQPLIGYSFEEDDNRFRVAYLAMGIAEIELCQMPMLLQAVPIGALFNANHQLNGLKDLLQQEVVVIEHSSHPGGELRVALTTFPEAMPNTLL